MKARFRSAEEHLIVCITTVIETQGVIEFPEYSTGLGRAYPEVLLEMSKKCGYQCLSHQSQQSTLVSRRVKLPRDN